MKNKEEQKTNKYELDREKKDPVRAITGKSVGETEPVATSRDRSLEHHSVMSDAFKAHDASHPKEALTPRGNPARASESIVATGITNKAAAEAAFSILGFSAKFLRQRWKPVLALTALGVGSYYLIRAYRNGAKDETLSPSERMENALQREGRPSVDLKERHGPSHKNRSTDFLQ